MGTLPPGIWDTGVDYDEVPAASTPITNDPAYLTSDGGLVGDRFTEAKNLSTEAWNAALAYLEDLADQEYIIPWTPLEVEDVDGISVVCIRPSPIEFIPIDFNFQPFTEDVPRMEDVTTNIGDVPEFTGEEPLYVIPDPPDVAWPVFTKEAPPLSDITYPVSPDFDLPTIPILTPVVVPGPPDFQMPDFEGTLPVFDADAPEPMFVWNEAEYSSDILDALNIKLLNDIANGGSGLSEETEQAIYDRATSRQTVANEAEFTKTLNFWADRGHTVPPGALNGALVEMRARIVKVFEDLNNDILVQQSKLAQENTHFIISTAIVYEKNLMDRTNQVQQRAYDAARYTTEFAIILYEVKVKAYLGELEAYKTYALVFESRIRAEIAKAEFYRAQIEGLKLNIELQQAAVSLYRAQIEGIGALIGLYSAQMQAAGIQAQVDKVKIDGYAAEVGAFAAKSGALVSRYNAYQAQIAGEAEKARMYVAQAQAYTARVGGYKAKADVELSRVQIEVEKLKGNMTGYLALIDKYKADITAIVGEAEILSKVQGHHVDIYKADTQLYSVEVDALIKDYLGRIEELKVGADIQIKEADTSVRALLGQYELTQKSLDSGARVAAQLAASALSSVSASAHLQFGEQRSDSRGYTAGWHANTGFTRSLSHDETAAVIRTNRREEHTYNPGERMFGV